MPQNASMPPTLSFSKGGNTGCDPNNSDSRTHTSRASLSGTSGAAASLWFKRERRVTSSHTDSRVKGGQTITLHQAGEMKDVRKSRQARSPFKHEGVGPKAGQTDSPGTTKMPGVPCLPGRGGQKSCHQPHLPGQVRRAPAGMGNVSNSS